MKKFIKSFDGVRIHYELHIGEVNKNILFIHGLGGDLRAWDEERALLENRGYTTIALDLRGHGLSDRPSPESAYAFTNFVRDIQMIIEKEKLQNVILVGHCLGGMIAMSVAYLYPKQIRALVLVDTSYKAPYFSKIIINHTLIQLFLRLFATYIPGFYMHGTVDYTKFRFTDDFDKKRILSDIMHTSLKSYLLICENLLSLNGEKLLDGINIPTLVIEGEKDKVYPPSIAKHISLRMKNANLDLIKDANHIIVLTKPSELVESIILFLQKFNS